MLLAPARLTARLVMLVSLSLVLVVAVSGPVQAADTEAHRVAQIAKTKIGAPWVNGATGPNSYDCIGFVYDTFRDAGLRGRIGGWRSVRSYYDWFAARGRASRTNGRRGDLVIWGNFRHIGIYLGKGRAISALVNGVQIHRLHNLTAPFRTFLHVRLERSW